MSIRKFKIITVTALLLFSAACVYAQEDESAKKTDASKKAANPICAIYAVPVEYDHYEKVGPYDGTMDVITLKPIIPIAINEDWNLVSRTIIPYLRQDGVVPEKITMSGIELDAKEQLGYKYAGKNHGFWDIQESMFITPSKPMYGFIWGVGGAFGFPGEKDIAGITGKYAAGPTAAVVREDSIFTYGFLTNHLWSYAGRDRDYAKSGSAHALEEYHAVAPSIIPEGGLDLEVEAEDVSKTYIQPFLCLRFPTYTGISLTSESTYNWKTEKWSEPVIGLVTQVIKIGPQILQLKIGGHYWLTDNENDPDGWGYRGAVTMLFLK